MELLTAIESLAVYIRPHYFAAIPEVYHQLFTNGIVEYVTFGELAALEDPSGQFELAGCAGCRWSPPLVSIVKTNRPALCRVNSNMSTTSSTSGTSLLTDSTADSSETPSLTARDRLFCELHKTGFQMFKCKIHTC